MHSMNLLDLVGHMPPLAHLAPIYRPPFPLQLIILLPWQPSSSITHTTWHLVQYLACSSPIKVLPKLKNMPCYQPNCASIHIHFQKIQHLDFHTDYLRFVHRFMHHPVYLELQAQDVMFLMLQKFYIYVAALTIFSPGQIYTLPRVTSLPSHSSDN